MLGINPLRLAVLAAISLPGLVHAAETTQVADQVALMEQAKSQGIAGIAKKTLPVDARPAVVGEIVVTRILGEGVETKSKPAEQGDWVVRNHCPETGNEQYLVKATKFPKRYGEPQSKPDAEGFSAFRPIGQDMNYFIVSNQQGDFHFTAPWGEEMVAKVGDAIVQTPSDTKDTYRVAAAAFKCTYEITKPAKE
ncbi:hypothetical protein [Pleomorphomonas sp. PLEO]|uniref:hypothetical protein n=1 Tax=Pleomorphomonas sp. PLEO TaxID=3239306 RepID=UPI00351EC6C8